jgi:hypothetical protein
MSSSSYSCPILTKRDLSEQIAEKYSDIKCHEHTSSGSRVVPCGQKERHGEAKLLVLFVILLTSLTNNIISTPTTIELLKQKTHYSKFLCI